MSDILPSDEVALDFQDALQDLQINNRFEISNLTIIAKENTEHAQAISRALEKHIKTTSPNRKLPALYVLDSIVKNVGSPYTVYLGKNLYSTFMDAYTLVDSATRKNMEGMLKTWKEPVPGSHDTRPVFAPDVTRAIENALIKARTVFVQQQQQSKAQRPPFGLPPRPGSAYRNTPTPPQNASLFPPPGQQPYQNGYRSQQPTPLQYPSHPGTQPTPDLVASLLASINPQDPSRDASNLNQDIDNLIVRMQSRFAQNPWDQDLQVKLKALLDLQNIVRTQQLSPQAMNAIKAQLAQLSAGLAPAVAAQASLPTSAWQPPPTPVPQPYQPPAQSVPPPSTQPAGPMPAIDTNMLAQLLASTAPGQQKPSTPQLHAALPALQNLAPATQSPKPAAAAPAPAPAPSGNALLDALRAAGIVQASSSTPQPPPAAPPAPPLDLLAQLKSLGTLPLPLTNTPPHPHPPPPGAGHPIPPPLLRVPRTQASLSQPSTHFLPSLYAAQPNQCSSCGRRFGATDEGRERKARHLDWHFRVNQRIAEAVVRGMGRSWYLDEMEWIRLPVSDSSDSAAEEGGDEGGEVGVAGTGKGKGEGGLGKQRKWIPAPAAGTTNAACPICQERFEAVWEEEAQEWVWMDAVRVGGRVFHSSCHDEVARASGALAAMVPGTRSRSATPDTALGKRKAEGGAADALKRVKVVEGKV
ncbi:mRNA 3' end processing factor [Zalaria obscura]|uniref:mRNA 3' end processing factor n=1 Tax=Zalaria obscura TaxID=2024903 RepID=A0ACC3S6I7_9PEZI